MHVERDSDIHVAPAAFKVTAKKNLSVYIVNDIKSRFSDDIGKIAEIKAVFKSKSNTVDFFLHKPNFLRNVEEQKLSKLIINECAQNMDGKATSLIGTNAAPGSRYFTHHWSFTEAKTVLVS